MMSYKEQNEILGSINKLNPDVLYRTQILKTVGRSHMAPPEYTYIFKTQGCSDFLLLLSKEENTFIGNIGTEDGHPFIIDGYNKVNNTDLWIINQEKQGYYFVWAKNRAEFQSLWNYVYQKKTEQYNILLAKRQTEIGQIICPIYKYIYLTGWTQTNTNVKSVIVDLIGYDSFVKIITSDIINYDKYTSFLESTGEGCRTLNYLISGPPGTGKTTFIRKIASDLKLPIYIVDSKSIESTDISLILNPKNRGQKNKIVLFEDFDRYLTKTKRHNMSEILNELDGIEASEGCVRFFTCNNVSEIIKNDALMNRLSTRFQFNYPTPEQFKIKLDKMLTFWSDQDDTWLINNNLLKQEFLSLLNDKNNTVHKLTLRPFTNFVIRYLFQENCLQIMINQINELNFDTGTGADADVFNNIVNSKIK